MSAAHVEHSSGRATGYDGEEARRLRTNDMEIGVTDAVRK
jgi:hypothetical protein